MPARVSPLPFELFLALRYLQPKRTFVSVITLISVIGVMLGVAVLIIVISVMTGFDHQLRDSILGFNAHLQVNAFDNHMEDYQQVADLLKKNPKVKGAAPYIISQVFLETQPEIGESMAVGPYIRGVDPAQEGTISTLPKSIVEGAFDLKGHHILVGRALADQLRLKVGDPVAIYSIRDLRKMKEAKDKGDQELRTPEDYTVSGIFDLGYYEYNIAFVVTSLANAQDLFDMGSSVQGLMVMLHDPYDSDAMKAQIGQELNGKLRTGVQISTWQQTNKQILGALVVEKKVMTYILFFIMIVAAFGITSALITFVVQKTREIGMLKAIGASNIQVMWLFLSQSLLVGIMGVTAGYFTGMLAVSYRNEFLHVMNRLTGLELFHREIYGFTELPALIVPADIAVICGGSLLICLLAGLIPAWSASRLKPVEALRHE